MVHLVGPEWYCKYKEYSRARHGYLRKLIASRVRYFAHETQNNKLICLCLIVFISRFFVDCSSLVRSAVKDSPFMKSQVQWYLNAVRLNSSFPSKSMVLIFFLYTSMLSSLRMLRGSAFHNLEPLYSNILLPYFVLKCGVCNSK